MTDITWQVTVGGTVVPAYRADATGSAYGSVGSAHITTSIAAIDANGIDLYALTSGSGQTEVDISVAVGSGAVTRLFGGEYLTTTWDMDADTAVIHARSWAGALADQKRILTKIGSAVESALNPLAPGQVSAAGISNLNQTVGMIVTAIATEYGFTPVLNLSSSNNPTIGTLYGSDDQAFMPVPQSLWSILNQLARDTGYVVYDTPTKQLVFGTPGAGLPTLAPSYKVPAQGAAFPVRALKFTHQPRQNGTFRVLVIAYDPAKAQVAIGRASYVGANFAGQNGLTAGLATGTSAITADAALATINANGSTTVPLYTFHFDGLSQAQADTQAGAIANDIAKREVIASFECDGLPGIEQSQMAQFSGQIPSGFGGTTFYASGFSHTIVQPKAKQRDAQAGFLTRVKMLNVPSEALAAETAG